jgi:excisionase family DNA binding protein
MKANNPQETPQPLYLTVEEVAMQLRLGKTKVYEMITYEHLPVTRFGRCVRIRPSRLQEWLDERDRQSA